YARRSAILLTAVALTAVAGCTGGSSAGAGAASRQFTYWSSWQQSEPQASVLKKAIKSFEKDTGITVDVQWQGRKILTKLVPALHTGNVPDLVDQGYGPIRSALVDNDQAANLGSVYQMRIPGESHTVRDVIPVKLDKFTTTKNGMQYLVPYEVIGSCIWYNGRSLPQVAAHPPKTWHQFTALLAKRKTAGHNPLALDGDISGYAAMWVGTAVVRSLGAGSLQKLATEKNASGWGTPAARQAISNIANLVTKNYFIPGYSSSKWPAIQNEWASGKADLLFMGSWAPSETGPTATKAFEYRCFNFPKMGSNYSVPLSPIGFAIPKSAEHAGAAKKFIAYFMNKKRLSGISTVAKNLTPRTDIPAPKGLTDLQTSLSQHNTNQAVSGALSTWPDYLSKIFKPLSDQLLTGQVTAQQFITKIQQQQQHYWKAHG
ncbi:MAG: ABC transporter substrate-binding protein, partial [Sciscionella sp.]